MLEIILFLILGILVGTITGLIPGLHINLISTILTSNLALLGFVEPMALVAFLVSMAITHTYLDFIPSIFLGAPDEDTFLSVLPGHQLLKEGLGQEAAVLTLYGSLFALIIIILATPLFIYFIPFIEDKLGFFVPFVLIGFSAYLVLREKNIFIPFIVFILSGFLGFLTLNLPVKEPLLPLLTGLFGTSALIISIKQKSLLKEQQIKKLRDIKLDKEDFVKSTLAAFITAPFCSFLPGIGSGHAAVLGSEMIKQTRKSFLILNGYINTIIMGLSFVALYLLGKTRTGIAVGIKDIFPELSLIQLVYILAIASITGIVSFFLGVKISQVFAKNIQKINYSALSFGVLIFLVLLNIFFTNFLGLLVLFTGTFLGIYTILSGTKRINLMGCLLIPTIIYYLANYSL